MFHNLDFPSSTEQKQAVAAVECTEVRFATFLSGGFATMALINPPESKLAKRTSVEWCKAQG